MKLLVLLGDVATKAKDTNAAIDFYSRAVKFGTRLLDISPNDIILLASLAHPLNKALDFRRFRTVTGLQQKSI